MTRGVEAVFLVPELVEVLAEVGGLARAETLAGICQVCGNCENRLRDECDVDVSGAFGEADRVEPLRRHADGPADTQWG